jgi:hypothetical protein
MMPWAVGLDHSPGLGGAQAKFSVFGKPGETPSQTPTRGILLYFSPPAVSKSLGEGLLRNPLPEVSGVDFTYKETLLGSPWGVEDSVCFCVIVFLCFCVSV